MPQRPPVIGKAETHANPITVETQKGPLTTHYQMTFLNPHPEAANPAWPQRPDETGWRVL